MQAKAKPSTPDCIVSYCLLGLGSSTEVALLLACCCCTVPPTTPSPSGGTSANRTLRARCSISDQSVPQYCSWPQHTPLPLPCAVPSCLCGVFQTECRSKTDRRRLTMEMTPRRRTLLQSLPDLACDLTADGWAKKT